MFVFWSFFFSYWPHVLFVITSFHSHSDEYCQDFLHYPPIFHTFSPSIIHLVHHLARELVFPLRQHVILPTHNIKQCPCTPIILRLCPLPAHNSQHSSSLQIKELCCLSPRPHFPPGLPPACVFQGQDVLPIQKDGFNFLFSMFMYSPPSVSKIECGAFISCEKKGKYRSKESCMDGSMDEWTWMCG